MLTRVPVVSRREWTLSPLAVAVDELHAKTSALRRTLVARAHGIDTKRLQLQLQGIVNTTVCRPFHNHTSCR